MLGLGIVMATIQASDSPLQFRLTFDPAISQQPFNGRVYVMLSTKPIPSLRGAPNWFKPEPMFALDVKDWKPNEPLILGSNALGHPTSLGSLPNANYFIQAVMDFDRGNISFATAEGNGYSKAIQNDLNPKTSGTVDLRLDQIHHEPPFVETPRVKLVDIPSKLLTAYHGRPVRLRAGVVLPKSYNDQPKRNYPIIYEIPGFGGNHRGALRAVDRDCTNVAGTEMVYVVLDPLCRTGHHVFADSENNGPCGQALIEELIPAIEKAYRGPASPSQRLVTGHSSGGWSSLWLQITYPETFGGVWSTAPDPVDFRDFQMVNLLKPDASLFVDSAGQKRPLARRDGKPTVYTRNFSDMETVMGHGGQLASFEAVFSPRGPDGQPMKLWDRNTGAIDPKVAASWERYDIRKILEKNWNQLGPRLAGKIHVYMGEEDTFYLEGATRLLGQTLKKLGSDAVVELFPKKDHGTLMDAAMRKRIAEEMAAQVRRQPNSPNSGQE